MATQGDLFADFQQPVQALPEGMALWHDVVTPAEEQALTEAIDAAPLTPFRFHQWEGKRLTASYGFGYDYGAAQVLDAPPFPEWLREIAGLAADRADLDPQAFVQGLLIRYDPGAGIGWHRDRPQFGTVLGLSLSSAVVLRMRRRLARGFERCAVTLPPRSLYRLDGPARWEWEHSIVPVAETRRAITLRSLRTSD
ncbi:alpha-ketoglutarate-dependent dioxygenase AlkB [Novosphingobium sp. G106]|uniref:alpha-ketoglutarate-dependent dioxygenase AlkB n=1 Tax=Novosphingobium sp. G106 TaxID=2849500 RepID=UPI001C2DA8EA|nr:alpha-ketoglutarate-dependent dioxygenase AlkB [Novosphingobium sp. G106]MBV1690605.1 alpha-ketoglutarate-dependent dioxygenase AlkB [Novosphingobium sp. G106]